MPRNDSLTKWLLSALLAVVMLIVPAFVTFTYRALAEDVEAHEQKIEKLSEAVDAIKTQGAVNQALQEQSRALQSQQTELLRALLEEVKSRKRPEG